MSADLQVLLDRVARAMESVVPDLALTPEIGRLVWLENDTTTEPWPMTVVNGGTDMAMPVHGKGGLKTALSMVEA